MHLSWTRGDREGLEEVGETKETSLSVLRGEELVRVGEPSVIIAAEYAGEAAGVESRWRWRNPDVPYPIDAG